MHPCHRVTRRSAQPHPHPTRPASVSPVGGQCWRCGQCWATISHTRTRLTHLTHLHRAGIRPSEPLGVPRLVAGSFGVPTWLGRVRTRTRTGTGLQELLTSCTPLLLLFLSDQLPRTNKGMTPPSTALSPPLGSPRCRARLCRGTPCHTVPIHHITLPHPLSHHLHLPGTLRLGHIVRFWGSTCGEGKAERSEGASSPEGDSEEPVW